jgi:hypothetical protein
VGLCRAGAGLQRAPEAQLLDLSRGPRNRALLSSLGPDFDVGRHLHEQVRAELAAALAERIRN